jgi:hypothetical protein
MTSIIQDYSNIDNSHYVKAQQTSSMLMNTDSQDRITNPQFFSMLDQQTFAGFSSQDDIKITNGIRTMEEEYKFLTDATVDINMMNNMHKYIETNNNHEVDRLNNLTQNSKNMLQKAKFETKELKNTSSIYAYYINIILLSLFFATIFLILILSIKTYEIDISKNLLYAIIAFIAILYMVLVVLYYRDSLRRRTDDWDKIIFNPPQN